MFSKSTSSWFGSEISFSVFSPGQPALAVTQKPSSLPTSGQPSDQGSAAHQINPPGHTLTSPAQPKPPSGCNQENEIAQTRWAKPASPRRNDDAGKVPDSHKGHEIKHDRDTSKDTHPTESSQVNNLHVEKKTPDLNQLTKDQQLEEEERLLLAKIHQMTSGTSPLSSPRGMKRLIPDPSEIERDTAELTDVTSCFDALPGISVTEGAEPLTTQLGADREGEQDA